MGRLTHFSVPPLSALSRGIGGPDAREDFKGGIPSLTYKLGGKENITVEVNNVLVNTEIHNVFGVIKGLTDPGKADIFSPSVLRWDDRFCLNIHGVFDGDLQIATSSWELRGTPGVKVTPNPPLAPLCW